MKELKWGSTVYRTAEDLLTVAQLVESGAWVLPNELCQLAETLKEESEEQGVDHFERHCPPELIEAWGGDPEGPSEDIRSMYMFLSCGDSTLSENLIARSRTVKAECEQQQLDHFVSHCTQELLDAAWGYHKGEEIVPLQGGMGGHGSLTSLAPLTEMHALKELICRDNRISDISPLTELPALARISLQKNMVTDISPLAGLSALAGLLLDDNRVESIAPLANHPTLAFLSLDGNPITDLRTLETLPSLQRLYLRIDQFPLLCECDCLPALEELHFSQVDYTKSDVEVLIEKLPDMPRLRVLKLVDCETLKGMDRFEGLVNLEVDDEQLRLTETLFLPELTHLTIRTRGELDLHYLRECDALLDLSVSTESIINEESLLALRNLREFRLYPDHLNTRRIRSIRKKLRSWADLFERRNPVGKPDLRIEVVDNETFNHFDGEPFGITDADENILFLDSERYWIEELVETVLAKRYTHEEDFYLPGKNAGGRSFSLVAYHPSIYRKPARVFKKIQQCLLRMKNPWIVYFQTDMWEHYGQTEEEPPPDFTVWIYPDHIMVTEERAPLVKKLLGDKSR